MKLVIIESPYAGDVDLNVRYARAAMLECLNRGEAPIASHLLYTQPGVLDDLVPEQRTLGIAAGLAWRAKADAAVFYVDLGWSKGMLAAKDVYDATAVPWIQRRLAAYDDVLRADYDARISTRRARYAGKMKQTYISCPYEEWNRRYLERLDQLGMELSSVKLNDYEIQAPIPTSIEPNAWPAEMYIVEKGRLQD